MTEDRIDRTVRHGGRGIEMNEQNQDIQTGDIVEFTVKGERRTAEVMLVTMDDVVLLDLFDGDRPAWARRATLEDVAIFRPDVVEVLVAA
jgi:phosphopantothenate synthetase